MYRSPRNFGLLGDEGDEGVATALVFVLFVLVMIGLGKGEPSTFEVLRCKPRKMLGEEAARPGDAGKKPASLCDAIWCD